MLSGTQCKHLRGLAHGLRPAVHVGKEGLTEGVVAAVDAALEASELVKVRIVGERDNRASVTAEMERRLACEGVGTVGRMAMLYRQHPDPEERKIELPG